MCATVEIIARLRPFLVDYALLRLHNRADAEDAAQEALVAALEGLHRFAGESSLRTWVVGILKHKISDSLRSRGRTEPWEPDDTAAPARDGDPEAGCVRRRLLHSLQQRLAEMPPRAAQVFVARAVLGVDAADVCRDLAISGTNCAVLLHRARARLRQCPELAAHAL